MLLKDVFNPKLLYKGRVTDAYFRNIIFGNMTEILFMCITYYFKLFPRSYAIKTVSEEFEFV